MEKEVTIEDLGYSPFFETSRNQLGLDGFAVARVTAEHKEAYTVKNGQGEFRAKVTGRHMFTASTREDYPAVGDWVATEKVDSGHAVIKGVLPRQTVIKRKHGDKNRAGAKDKTQIIAANVDVAFVVESVDRDYNVNRIERYFAIVQDGGVTPVILLNKTDLISKEELDEKLAELRKRFPGADIIVTSTVNNEGLGELRQYITSGKTYCFLGSSGVGKSSLINTLLGASVIKTGEISTYSERGRHITTGRHMYFLDNGGIVVDNPGMREVGVSQSSGGVDGLYEEISVLSQGCKYADCAHTHEPGCEVIRAVESGVLDKEKYANYINLKKETGYYEMSDVDKRKKDRQFGKFMKKAKKDLRDLGHKYY